MKRIICILLTWIMLFSLSVAVGANETTARVTLKQGKFIVSGSTDDYYRISLLVYSPAENGLTKLYYFDGKNEVMGDFSFEIPITENAKTGVYTFLLGYDGLKPTQEKLSLSFYGNDSNIKSFKTEGKITSGGILTGACELFGYEDGDEVPAVVIAVYEKTKDGTIRLISANYSNEVLNDSGTDLIKVQIKLPENVENYFAKAMLLEEIKNIIPITDEIIFD